MNSGAIFYIVIILSVLLLLGVGLIKAARWSQKKNMKLKASGEDSQSQALRKVLSGDNLKESIISYYASSVSKPEAFIGKSLAILVIVFITVLIILGVYIA